MNTENLFYAFLATTIAGLATGIGSIIAYFFSDKNKGFISFSLGLSAGVMIYISFMEILSHAQDSLSGIYGDKIGVAYAAAAFFAGILLVAAIDFLMPSDNHSKDIQPLVHKNERGQDGSDKRAKLRRMGIMTAAVVAIHNFPEGISTFVATLQTPSLGIAITLAIALHNIPEGIAVYVPIYASTGNKSKAFWYSVGSGLAEPLGAVLTYLILLPYINETIMAVLLAAVAGIMIYISVDELLPAAREYGKAHTSMIGFVLGMAVMIISLLFI